MTAQGRPLGTAGMILGINDLHLVAKVFNDNNDEDLRDMGYTDEEISRGKHLFEKLDAHVGAYFGNNWQEAEVL